MDSCFKKEQPPAVGETLQQGGTEAAGRQGGREAHQTAHTTPALSDLQKQSMGRP